MVPATMWGELLQFSFTVYASRENYPNAIIGEDGLFLTDIKNIFESTADEISLELDLDVTNTIDHIYKFNFNSYVNVEEQAVLYTADGYVAHSIMKKDISCHSCSQIASTGKMPLEINFQMINEPNADEVYAREEFMRPINRGGLIKPSDLLYGACLLFLI